MVFYTRNKKEKICINKSYFVTIGVIVFLFGLLFVSQRSSEQKKVIQSQAQEDVECKYYSSLDICQEADCEVCRQCKGDTLGRSYYCYLKKKAEVGPQVFPVITPVGIRTQILGVVDGNYSPFIKDNHLETKVLELNNNDDRLARVEAGYAYLRKLRDALKSYSDHGPLLSDYKINSSENFPIEVDGWTVYDYIDNLVNEYDSGKIQPTLRDYRGSIVSTLSDIENKNGIWVRRITHVYVNGLLNTDKYYIQQETPDSYYVGRTDLEMALALTHEYGHTRQEEAGLRYINEYIGPIKDIAKEFADFRQKGIDRARQAIINRVPSGDRAKIEPIVSKIIPNELQPDSISFIILQFINKLNNSEYFPGTRRRNPRFQFNIDATQVRYPNSVSRDQYERFLDTAGKKYDVLDPQWAVEWSGYNYP